MTDETEAGGDPDGLGPIVTEGESEAEYVECEKGQIIFPHGCAWYADTHGFNALFVDYKTAVITGEDNETGLMRLPSRKPAQLTAIK